MESCSNSTNIEDTDSDSTVSNASSCNSFNQLYSFDPEVPERNLTPLSPYEGNVRIQMQRRFERLLKLPALKSGKSGTNALGPMHAGAGDLFFHHVFIISPFSHH